MASRSVSVGWFFVGFLAGVGATLAGIIFATRPQPTRIALPAPPPAVAAGKAIVTYHAPQVAEASPPLAGPILPHPQESPAAPAAQPPAPAASTAAPPAARPPSPAHPAGPDQQTREDAAAAGMTSRARTG